MPSNPRRSSPPPLCLQAEPPPPLPVLDAAKRDLCVGSPSKSVKLVTSKSENNIGVQNDLKNINGHVLQHSGGGNLLPRSPLPPLIENERTQPVPKLQARWSGYVPRDRPPADHGKTFLYSIPNRYPDVRAKELCRMINELSPDDAAGVCPPTRHRRLSSLSELARLVPGHQRVQSDTPDRSSSLRRGRSLNIMRPPISRKDKANSKLVTYKATPKTNRAAKSVKYGRIVNSAMDWDNLEKWGQWEQYQWDGIRGMIEYADRDLDTIIFRVNDVDESRRSKVMMHDLVQAASPHVAMQSDDRKSEEVSVAEAKPPSFDPPPSPDPPPNLLATPRAESLHFDPSSFKVKDDASPKATVAREPQPRSGNSFMLKSPSHRSLHQKRSSIASVVALTSRLRHRSRSPVKRESASSGKKFGREETGYTRFRNFLEYHQKRQLQDQVVEDVEECLQPDSEKLDPPAPQDPVVAVKTPSQIPCQTDATLPNHEKDVSSPKQEPTHHHTKSISIASTASIADARAVFMSCPGTPRKHSDTTTSIPKSPGPAPSTELPPVPEGIAPVLPRTPRNSFSCPQTSDLRPKSRGSPEKYSLYPSVSPEKLSSSPTKPAAVRVRMIQAESFPKPPSLTPSPERLASTRSSPSRPSPYRSPRKRIHNDNGKRETAPATQEHTHVSNRKLIMTAEQADDKENVDPAFDASSMADLYFKINQGSPSKGSPRNNKRHSKRESHITEDILSEYTDSTNDLPPTPITAVKPIQSGLQARCMMSAIIVNAEQSPQQPSRPTSITTDKSRQSLDPGAALQASLSYEAALRNMDGQRSTSDSVVPVMTSEAMPDRTSTLKSHEALFKSVNHSSAPSLQRSSQRSSMTDSAMEARLSQLEHSNLMLREAIMAIVNASAEAGVSPNLGVGTGFEDGVFGSAERKDPMSALHASRNGVLTHDQSANGVV